MAGNVIIKILLKYINIYNLRRLAIRADREETGVIFLSRIKTKKVNKNLILL